jgi:Tfp pilus assembly protein PilF
MSDRKQKRRTPGGGTAVTSAVAVLGVIVAVVAVGGCNGVTGTAKARPAADLRKAGAGATSAVIGGSTAVSTVAALLQTGIGQAERHDWSAATTTFKDVLAVSPHNVYALYNLGLVDQSTGNSAGADDYYEQAIAVNGSYTPALYNLAITQENSDPARALGLYEKIVAINPQASTAYLRMAFVYARRGELGLAKTAQAKAIAIDPTLGKYRLPGIGD